MNVVIISPHPDDETLGCGGTLLRHLHDGDKVNWVIVTSVSEVQGYSKDWIGNREQEIKTVSSAYGFSSLYKVGIPACSVGCDERQSLVSEINQLIKETSAEIIYLPFPGDVHTDHREVFDAAASASKWFRAPSVKRILCYEVLSETEIALTPDRLGFRPNVFVDITDYLDRKIEIMKIYQSEIGDFPFPRSEGAVRALSVYRGAVSGLRAAEAFMLLREII